MSIRASLLFVSLAAACSAACGMQALDVGSNGHGAPDEPESPAADPSRTTDGTSAAPNSACVELGPTAKLLLELPIDDQLAEIRHLVPDGDTLWVDAVRYDQQSGPGHGRLSKITLRDGVATQVTPESYGRLAGVFGGRLVYVQRSEQGEPPVEQLVIRDVLAGTSELVPNPRPAVDVSPVMIHPTGIYWLSHEAAPTVSPRISRFDTRARELATLGPTTMATDGRELFYVRGFLVATAEHHAADFDITIEAMSIKGGEPHLLRHLRPAHASLSVVGVDDAEVYLQTSTWTDEGTFLPADLLAMKKDGSAERVVVSGQSFGDKSLRFDPDFVTWIDGAIPTLPLAPPTLMRVRRTGGPVERIVAGEPNQLVTALTVDRCNIYWGTTNPMQVYGRSRL